MLQFVSTLSVSIFSLSSIHIKTHLLGRHYTVESNSSLLSSSHLDVIILSWRHVCFDRLKKLNDVFWKGATFDSHPQKKKDTLF